jgi:DNA-binding transcriptional LysR family regulator
VAVFEAGNMSKAGEVLGLATSSVSHNIRELESQLAVKLFHTSPRGAKATKEAEELYKYVAPAVNALRNGETAVRLFTSDSKRSIDIGCGAHFTSYILIDFIKNFKEKYPNITLNIYNEPVSVSIDMLKKHTLDVLITTASLQIDTNFEKKELKKVNYVFLAEKDFLKKHGYGSDITSEQVKDLPIILHKGSDMYSGLITDYELQDKNVMFTTSPELTYKMMSQGLGITCCLEDIYQNDPHREKISVLNIKNIQPIKRSFSCVYDKDIKDKAVLEFIKELKFYYL